MSDSNHTVGVPSSNYTLPVDPFLISGVGRAEVAVESAFLLLVSSVAFTANASLWLVVLTTRDLRTESNVLILCLSLADLLVAVVGAPITISTIISSRWLFSSVFCTFVGYMNMLTFVASVQSLGVISVNRYFKICRPSKFIDIYTYRNVTLMFAGVWIYSGILSVPPLIGWAAYDFLPLASICFCDWQRSPSYAVFMIVMCFCVPCFAMILCYVAIIKAFLRSRRTVQAFANSHRRLKSGQPSPDVSASRYTSNDDVTYRNQRQKSGHPSPDVSTNHYTSNDDITSRNQKSKAGSPSLDVSGNSHADSNNVSARRTAASSRAVMAITPGNGLEQTCHRMELSVPGRGDRNDKGHLVEDATSNKMSGVSIRNNNNSVAQNDLDRRSPSDNRSVKVKERANVTGDTPETAEWTQTSEATSGQDLTTESVPRHARGDYSCPGIREREGSPMITVSDSSNPIVPELQWKFPNEHAEPDLDSDFSDDQNVLSVSVENDEITPGDHTLSEKVLSHKNSGSSCMKNNYGAKMNEKNATDCSLDSLPRAEIVSKDYGLSPPVSEVGSCTVMAPRTISFVKGEGDPGDTTLTNGSVPVVRGQHGPSFEGDRPLVRRATKKPTITTPLLVPTNSARNSLDPSVSHSPSSATTSLGSSDFSNSSNQRVQLIKFRKFEGDIPKFTRKPSSPTGNSLRLSKSDEQLHRYSTKLPWNDDEEDDTLGELNAFVSSLKNRKDSARPLSVSSPDISVVAPAEKKKRKHKRGIHSARRTKEEFQLAASLLVVILIFIVCWFPYCISMFVSITTPEKSTHGLDMSSLLLGYMNSCVNPIVYGLMNRRFKMGYQKLYSTCLRFIPFIKKSRLRIAPSTNKINHSVSSMA